MEAPTENNSIVWNAEEDAETFKNLLKEVEEASDTGYFEFFQELHTKAIAGRVQDWIRLVAGKAYKEYRVQITHRESLISQITTFIYEKRDDLKSQSEWNGNSSERIYSQKLMELQKQFTTNETEFVRMKKIMETVEKAATRSRFYSHRFAEKMATWPEKFFAPIPDKLFAPIPDNLFAPILSHDSLRRMAEGVSRKKFFERVVSYHRGHMIEDLYPKEFFELLISDEIVREGSKKKRWESQRKWNQLDLFPGPDARAIFKTFWPQRRNSVSRKQKMGHRSSPSDSTNTFPLFSKFPLEIRRKIWKEALPDGRIVFSKENPPPAWFLEQQESKKALHLVCKESYEVARDNYVFTFEMRRESNPTGQRIGHHPASATADAHRMPPSVVGKYINPNKDIVIRGRCNCADFPGNDFKRCCTNNLFGFAAVKHLGLDLYHFVASHPMISSNRIDMDQFNRIQASCPNLERLTIILFEPMWYYLGNDVYKGQRYRLMEINSSLIDHILATPCAGRVQRDYRKDLFQPMLKTYKDFFEKARENSGFWRRLKLQLALIVNPRHDWHDLHDMYNRYEGISLMFEGAHA